MTLAGAGKASLLLGLCVGNFALAVVGLQGVWIGEASLFDFDCSGVSKCQGSKATGVLAGVFLGLAVLGALIAVFSQKVRFAHLAGLLFMGGLFSLTAFAVWASLIQPSQFKVGWGAYILLIVAFLAFFQAFFAVKYAHETPASSEAGAPKADNTAKEVQLNQTGTSGNLQIPPRPQTATSGNLQIPPRPQGGSQRDYNPFKPVDVGQTGVAQV